ncbi:hypothetical protein B7R74_19450 [Yersinia pseudotuberculosis]|nr:hypothetical protein B7R74_19450 [Yersinia pseudotuberculosis]
MSVVNKQENAVKAGTLHIMKAKYDFSMADAIQGTFTAIYPLTTFIKINILDSIIKHLYNNDNHFYYHNSFLSIQSFCTCLATSFSSLTF